MDETRLQIALRHVASASEIVAAQTALVDGLQAAGRDATVELLLLAQFKRMLTIFEGDLRRAQQEEAAATATQATMRGHGPLPDGG
jgi:hypothetical protein